MSKLIVKKAVIGCKMAELAGRGFGGIWRINHGIDPCSPGHSYSLAQHEAIQNRAIKGGSPVCDNGRNAKHQPGQVSDNFLRFLPILLKICGFNPGQIRDFWRDGMTDIDQIIHQRYRLFPFHVPEAGSNFNYLASFDIKSGCF
jgi:hypothetical protein